MLQLHPKPSLSSPNIYCFDASVDKKYRRNLKMSPYYKISVEVWAGNLNNANLL